MAGVRPPMRGLNEPLGANGKALYTVSGKGLNPGGPWQVALLFRGARGFFQYGGECGLGIEQVET